MGLMPHMVLAKSRWMTMMGLGFFLIMMSPAMIPLFEAVDFAPGVIIFEYIANHQIGVILLGMPFLIWELIKDWRIIGVAVMITLIFLKVKTAIF